MIKQRIFSVICVIIMLVGLIPFGAYAAVVPYLDVSDVEEDLAGLQVDKKYFAESDYPVVDGGSPEVLGVYEYDPGGSDYALYVYIYNPDCSNSKHTYSYSAFYGTVWAWAETFDSLEFTIELTGEPSCVLIGHSEDYRFLKLKIDLDALTPSVGVAGTRIYSVGVVYWYTAMSEYADSNGKYVEEVHQVDCGSYCNRYTFGKRGARYYSSGACIDLELKHSIYLTDSSPKGDYYRQALYTCYFALDNSYIEDYDALTGLSCKWNECHTAAGVCTDDEDLFKLISSMAKKADYKNSLLNNIYCSDYGTIVANWQRLSTGLYTYFSADYSLNAPKDSGLSCNYGTALSKLGGIFLVEDMDDYYLTPDNITGYLSTVDDGCVFGEQIHSYTTSDLLSLTGRWKDNWFNNILKKFTTGLDDSDVILDPFYVVQSSDITGKTYSQIAQDLYIGDEYIDDFMSYYSRNISNDKTVILFRFAVRDYYSAPARYCGEGYSYYSEKANCTLSFGTAFLDYNVISLTFSNEDVSYHFVVNSDSIDIVPGVYSPVSVGLDLSGILDPFSSFLNVVKLIFAVVITLVCVILITKIIKKFMRKRQ